MNSVNAFMTSQEELPSSQSPSSSQTSTNSFTEIHRLCQELAQTIFTASSDMQYDRIQQLLTLKESWENNITTMIQPLNINQVNERLKISLDDSLISVYSEAESTDANEQAEPKEQTESNDQAELSVLAEPTKQSASNEQVNLTKLRLVKAPKIGRPHKKRRLRFSIKNGKLLLNKSNANAKKVVQRGANNKINASSSLDLELQQPKPSTATESEEEVIATGASILSDNIPLRKSKRKAIDSSSDAHKRFKYDDELLLNFNSFLSSVLIHTDNLERFLSCNNHLIEESDIKVILNCASKLIYDKLISKNFPFASHFTSELWNF